MTKKSLIKLAAYRESIRQYERIAPHKEKSFNTKHHNFFVFFCKLMTFTQSLFCFFFILDGIMVLQAVRVSVVICNTTNEKRRISLLLVHLILAG